VIKDTGITAFGAEALQNPQIRDLSWRVIVRDDPDLSGCTPLERPSHVKVILKSGEALEVSVWMPSGEFDMEPMSEDQISEKYTALASSAIGAEKTGELMEKLWRIDSVQDIREMTALCVSR
jgi:2-methylcitrate dehydratase PrpD